MAEQHICLTEFAVLLDIFTTQLKPTAVDVKQKYTRIKISNIHGQVEPEPLNEWLVSHQASA